MLDRLSSEFGLIRGAPVAFIVSMAATGLIVFFAVRMHYEAKIKHLQAVVGLQNEQIASAPAAPQNPFAPQVGPRHLSALQKKFLTRVLSHAPKPAVVYVSSAPDDAETADYAKDLLGTISGAGWTTRAGIANLEPPMPAPFLKLPGLILFVNDRDKAPGAKVLQQAMTIAGIAVRWGGDPRLPANTCELLVGAEPSNAPNVGAAPHTGA